jgi:DNA-binding NtrC family response regulator
LRQEPLPSREAAIDVIYRGCRLLFSGYFTDLKMSGMDGMELLELVKKCENDSLVLMLTAFGSMASAEEAIAKGAFDYISKPFRKEQPLLAIDKAMRWREMALQNKELKKRLESG